MNSSKSYKINKKYLAIDLTRIIVMATVMVVYSIILCIDCYRKGNPSTAHLALFDAIATLCTIPILIANKASRNPDSPLMKIRLHFSILFLCFIYWYTFGVFIYKGSMGGTSIFLLFLAAPISFYFFNYFYGLVFCLVVFTGMIIYMWSPLHLYGYPFPDMYFVRLPLMYLLEVIICALAQYEIIKAQSIQEAALLEAEEANHAKTDFLSNMSHEIRTPINAVLGMNEMITRDSIQAMDDLPEDQEQAKNALSNISKYSRNIESAGNNLLFIINDILDFSKIEAGKLEIINAEYRLSSVLNDVSNMIFFKAKDKGLEFIADVDETLPDRLMGDEIRVRQVITNLLTNAVKYTKEGSVRLSVRKGNADSDNDDKSICLEVTVSDTGIGIKEEDIGRLFNKFERVNLIQNSTVEGTGLGLAITQNLLDKMGGNIRVNSTYGKGSDFTVFIPQQVIDKEPVGNFHEKFEKSMQSVQTYHESFHAPGARILIVDDTKMNLMVVVGLLKNTGIHVDTATSGAESIELAGKECYDVILMDQRMPEMDGTEAMHRILEDKNALNINTPFICLTADAVSGAKERYLSQGFTDYLTKPIDSAALEKMLLKHLPAQKVQISRKEITDGEESADNSSVIVPEAFSPLVEAGLNVATGLRYSSNDTEFYRTLIKEYIQSSAEKKENIRKYYDTKDWDNYGIYVHSLKSTSRTIGAEDLAVKAARLESAAKKSDENLIHAENEPVMEQYDKVLKILMDFMPEADIDSGDDEEIMEFLPDSE